MVSLNQKKNMETKTNKALELFKGDYNCAQSTLSVFSKALEIDATTLQNFTAGFGAGMCYQGRTCGAVAGAYMALGLYSGKTNADAETVKKNTRERIEKFNHYFENKHKSTLCRVLLGEDVSTAIGLEKARMQGVFENRCPNFIISAVEWLEQNLDEPENKSKV
jgi:C_GCAxxG_C_C family probable redox protein